jgi:hypothetical protein
MFSQDSLSFAETFFEFLLCLCNVYFPLNVFYEHFMNQQIKISSAFFFETLLTLLDVLSQDTDLIFLFGSSG